MTQDHLSEDDISVKYITPALHKAGWDATTAKCEGRAASEQAWQIRLVQVKGILAEELRR